MIRITSTKLCASDFEPTFAYHYEIAGERVVFQARVNTLHAYEVERASKSFSELMSKNVEYKILNADNSSLHYQGKAQFVGRLRDVTCWQGDNGIQLDIEGTPICRIDFKGDRIHLLTSGDFDDRLALEAVTGPALIVLLAMRSIYCLHAGAVQTDVGNVLFIAESGVGKSTLSAQTGQSWNQLSDDLFPISYKGKLRGLSRFPLLKLPNATVAFNGAASETIEIIFSLSDQPVKEISFERLSATDALLQIIRHTVAARLYDKSVMKKHIRFARHVVKNIPIVKLSYPRDYDQLPLLRKEITSYIKRGDFN